MRRPTIDEVIAAATREIGMRHRVYPRRIAEGKMSREKADHEIACMQRLLDLALEKRAEERPDLFTANIVPKAVPCESDGFGGAGTVTYTPMHPGISDDAPPATDLCPECLRPYCDCRR